MNEGLSAIEWAELTFIVAGEFGRTGKCRLLMERIKCIADAAASMEKLAHMPRDNNPSIEARRFVAKIIKPEKRHDDE